MRIRFLPDRFIKPAAIIAGLLGFYALFGYFLLPALLTWQLPGIIQDATGRKSSVDKIQFDPFSLRLSVRGFAIEEAGGGPFVGFDQFYIDLNAFRSIGNLALVIDKIILDKPSVRLVRLKNGQFNFESLTQGPSEPEPEEKKGEGLFPLMIEKFSLREGKVAWLDQRSEKPRQEEISPLSFEVDQFTTKESEHFPMHVLFSLGSGGQLDWQGTASLHPLASNGKIKLDKVNLERVQELALENVIDFDLKGSESINLDYKFSYSDKGIDLLVDNSRIELKDFGFSERKTDGLALKFPKLVLESVYKFNQMADKWKLAVDNTKLGIENIELAGINQSKAVVTLSGLKLDAGLAMEQVDKGTSIKISGSELTVHDYQLLEKGNKDPYNHIPEARLSGIGVDVTNKDLTIENVKVNEGDFKAWLDPSGKLNYIALFANAYMEATENPGEPSQKTVKKPEEASQPWHINVNHIEVNQTAFTFEDKTLKKKVTMKAKPINIKVDGFSSDKDKKMDVHIATGINQTGSIKVDGNAILEPFSSTISLNVSNIELEPFQPYVEPHARLDIMDGNFNLNGDLSVVVDDKKGLDLKFKGNTSIAELLTRDQILHRDFVKWKKVSLEGVNADLQANRYTAKQLILNRPYARVTIKKDKSININDVLSSSEAKSSKPTTTRTQAKATSSGKLPPLYFKLDKVKMIDGASDFADLSLILPFAAPIQNLNGGATGVSSDPKSKMKVSLKGYAYELSPVDIGGEVSPFQGDFNVTLNFNGMPMPLVSPYMAQFAGYKIEKGKLTLGLKYQVEKKQLNASNSILIDQFELGEKVENPDAVSLPLELAIALLKDSSGKIKLDVPISGSLEDPQFSVGGIIFDALLNTLTKIVTSPFTAIASLIGSEENLDVVSFAPGQSALAADQTKKLEGLAKALQEKTALSLEIKGTAFQEQDWPALREAALVDQLKKMKADETNANGGKKILAEYVELSDDDYKELLADKFIKEFPQLADRSILGKPRLIDESAGDFYQVARDKLSQTIKPDPHRLKDLASDRAQAIAKFIVKQQGIPDSRVFILDPALDPDRKEHKDIVTFLSLKAG